jgi:V8-like Glu-specific endopeptidase
MAGRPEPLNNQELEGRSALSPDDADHAEHEITVCDFRLDNGREPRIERHPDDPNRFRVVAQVDADGLDVRPLADRIPVVRLGPSEIEEFREVRELDGYRAPATTLSFTPEQTKRIQPPYQEPWFEEYRDDGRDRGGTIWGADDRYLFQDRSFPWRTTGLIRVEGGRCSGTTIGPRLVLTASHCINWGEDTAGWVTFIPAYFDGRGPFGEFSATRVIYWNQAPARLTDQETAFDYVVLVMDRRVGDIVGYPGYRTYDDDWNGGSYWQYIGYPGEIDSGERPAFQGGGAISSVSNESLSGQTGFVMGHFNEFTPGQSGGSTWGWWGDEPCPRVVGVGSTIGSTAVQTPPGSPSNDNEYGGGPALSALIAWARSNFP